jgi:hypothetical protein
MPFHVQLPFVSPGHTCFGVVALHAPARLNLFVEFFPEVVFHRRAEFGKSRFVVLCEDGVASLPFGSIRFGASVARGPGDRRFEARHVFR